MIGLVLRLPKFMVYYGFSSGFICSYLSASQEIGWKERLRYDLYCVEWDVKPQLNQSTWFSDPGKMQDWVDLVMDNDAKWCFVTDLAHRSSYLTGLETISHAIQNKSFQRRYSQPICWLDTEKRISNTTQKHNMNSTSSLI